MAIIYEIISSPFGGEIIKGILEDGTNLWIPMDEGNSDYQAYLASLEK